MGPNGAGKSTLIKILGGVYGRSAGEITYGGKPVTSLADLPEVGFIHQDLGLIDDAVDHRQPSPRRGADAPLRPAARPRPRA